MSYHQLLKNRLIGPLNLKHTGLIKKKRDYKKIPKAYIAEGNVYASIGKSFFLQNYYSAGAVYSNTEDLLTIDQSLRKNKLLSSESQEKLYTSYPEYNYSAFGVWVYQYPFLNTYPKIMERRGSILGYQNVFVRFLNKNITLIILGNSDWFDPNTFGNQDNFKEKLIKATAKL